MKDFAKDNYHAIKAYREVFIHQKLSKKKCIYVPKVYQVIMEEQVDDKTKKPVKKNLSSNDLLKLDEKSNS